MGIGNWEYYMHDVRGHVWALGIVHVYAEGLEGKCYIKISILLRERGDCMLECIILSLKSNASMR